jgi:hypothetical protein
MTFLITQKPSGVWKGPGNLRPIPNSLSAITLITRDLIVPASLLLCATYSLTGGRNPHR